MRAYLPRFLLVIVAVPVIFLGAAWTVSLWRAETSPAADPIAVAASAVTFAALVLAPSTRNAIARAAIAGLVVGLGLCGALLVR